MSQPTPLVAQASSSQEMPALAPRTVRGLAVLVDSVILIPPTVIAVMASFGGVVGLLGGASRFHRSGAMASIKQLGMRAFGAGSTVIALVAWTVVILGSLYQFYLLGLQGQTIGKRFFGIRIVDMNGQPAGFVRALFLRTCLFPSVCAFVAGLVSPLLPLAASIIWIADLGFGLRADRRCLHDHFAGTQVRWARITSLHVRRIALAMTGIAAVGCSIVWAFYRTEVMAAYGFAREFASADVPQTPVPPPQPNVPQTATPLPVIMRSAPPRPPTDAQPAPPAPAREESADYYQYEDEDGAAHIVEGLEKVPASRRQTAQLLK